MGIDADLVHCEFVHVYGVLYTDFVGRGADFGDSVLSAFVRCYCKKFGFFEFFAVFAVFSVFSVFEFFNDFFIESLSDFDECDKISDV